MNLIIILHSHHFANKMPRVKKQKSHLQKAKYMKPDTQASSMFVYISGSVPGTSMEKFVISKEYKSHRHIIDTHISF